MSLGLRGNVNACCFPNLGFWIINFQPLCAQSGELLTLNLCQSPAETCTVQAVLNNPHMKDEDASKEKNVQRKRNQTSDLNLKKKYVFSKMSGARSSRLAQ